VDGADFADPGADADTSGSHRIAPLRADFAFGERSSYSRWYPKNLLQAQGASMTEPEADSANQDQGSASGGEATPPPNTGHDAGPRFDWAKHGPIQVVVVYPSSTGATGEPGAAAGAGPSVSIPPPERQGGEKPMVVSGNPILLFLVVMANLLVSLLVPPLMEDHAAKGRTAEISEQNREIDSLMETAKQAVQQNAAAQGDAIKQLNDRVAKVEERGAANQTTGVSAKEIAELQASLTTLNTNIQTLPGKLQPPAAQVYLVSPSGGVQAAAPVPARASTPGANPLPKPPNLTIGYTTGQANDGRVVTVQYSNADSESMPERENIEIFGSRPALTRDRGPGRESADACIRENQRQDPVVLQPGEVTLFHLREADIKGRKRDPLYLDLCVTFAAWDTSTLFTERPELIDIGTATKGLMDATTSSDVHTYITTK
jgi:hypothetical protein